MERLIGGVLAELISDEDEEMEDGYFPELNCRLTLYRHEVRFNIEKVNRYNQT